MTTSSTILRRTTSNQRMGPFVMPEPFKNLFNRRVIADMGRHFKRVWRAFDDAAFCEAAGAPMDQGSPMKPVTIRKYYAGTHRLEIQVNGCSCGGADFHLVL